VAAFSRASSNGVAHAEYSTGTIRNACHHLPARCCRDVSPCALIPNVHKCVRVHNASHESVRDVPVPALMVFPTE
jgi:hypothetical protein